MVRSAHVELHRLARTDERIAAHIDGLLVAKDAGRTICRNSLDPPGRGAMFAATVLALEAQDQSDLDSLLTIAQALPEAQAGFLSALGWVEATTLRGLVRDWFASPSVARQTVALAACGLQGVDPGAILRSCLDSEHPPMVERALRVAGTLGRTDLQSRVMARAESSDDEHSDIKVWAELCAVMLGNRSTALEALKAVALGPGALSDRCFKLALLASPIESAYAWLREWASFSKDPWARRRLIRGCGFSGDVRYVPWLIEQMNDGSVNRIAGESFSFITGAHLALQDLERKPPEHVTGGPTDEPLDDNVDMDEDDGLPWPDVARVHTWWSGQAAHFPAGQRYLLGAPASDAQCLKVLATGGQRQRAVAAVTRCVLKPGTALFQIAAPAWRQKRGLAELAA